MATSLARVTLIALFLLAACARTPARLVDKLVEGMHEEDVIVALGQTKSQFRVVQETSLPKGDPRPPYGEKTIAASDVSCAGQLSDISLSFYQTELREVTCYPKDVKAMVDALARAGVVAKDQRDFSITRGGLVIRGSESDGRWSVTFASVRLTEDQRRWVAKYS